ncbi:MAG: hypothetical protein QNI90_06125 [Dinoroseobacter sp.]|nr:hypothetical protein [Dinoroseobacter sp.]
MQRKVVLGIYLVVGLVNLIMGVIYFSSNEFLSYHSQATGASWDEVDPSTQTLILALMKLAGGGWLALGFFTISLTLAELRKSNSFARWILPIGTILFYLVSFVVTWGIYRNTGAASPWAPSLAMIALALVAFAADAPWAKQKRRPT